MKIADDVNHSSFVIDVLLECNMIILNYCDLTITTKLL